MADKGLMTLDEAAAYMGVAKINLRRWSRKGELPCVRIGKRGNRRFRQEDLDPYTRRSSPPAPNKSASSSSRRKGRPSWGR